ncbi:very-long-chain (3R)-3-hydroxyacyl-CoA dehydratase 2 [Dioscorea cayenensis subsp. rotundata]|uniref:Very-long-chain (3R)-3-hydroxyacyl-CoA dehydratase n=1 Tax=Dioscorea cayennensis subsp. rotundata TaxID=55577 RepID=A0AB40CXP0_DIOCR|nr:very-long-chain (3R)-3-hydroxyacyl-CoA dehydratase 2 [Dioscorea cayenensis subsp. rotundata]
MFVCSPRSIQPLVLCPMPRFSKLYLISYNSLLFLGWAIALSRLLGSFIATKSVNGAYAAAGELICWLQTVAFLEVIHSAVGLVPSGVMLVLMQWGGRTHFLLAIVSQITELQDLPSVFITFLAWSLSEVIRYSHYASSSLELCPSWLTYIRYTAFILLYPIGVGPGEMWLMYKALPFIKERNLYKSFFDSLPFSYHSFVVVVLALYPFLWLRLYLHLFKQRRSKLGKLQTKKKD